MDVLQIFYTKKYLQSNDPVVIETSKYLLVFRFCSAKIGNILYPFQFNGIGRSLACQVTGYLNGFGLQNFCNYCKTKYLYGEGRGVDFKLPARVFRRGLYAINDVIIIIQVHNFNDRGPSTYDIRSLGRQVGS